jgi:hypothetical protein
MTQTIAAKLSVAIVAVAMAFSLVAPAAQAQDVSSMSLEQLVALVNSLQGQLGSASSSSTCSYTFTRSLSQGTTGADVMNLQKFLNSDPDLVVSLSGAGSPGMETSYYGPATAAAVSKFQVKYSADILVPSGLTSPTGYFGPASMAKANKLCDGTTTPTGPGTGNDGDLEGGAGSLEETDTLSGLNNEEVGEGDEDVEVAGLEVTAEGSDLEITAVRINFDDEGTANNDDDLDEYASEVSIWVDGEEVARVDADEFNDDNDYEKTVTLEGGIIREDETGEIVVAISGTSNLDDASAGDSWSVDFESVRFRDAQDAVITENVSEDPITFTFEDFATASDLEVSVSKGDDEINDSRSIEVSSTTETDGVEILSFEIEVDGNSDITIDDLPVSFVAVGADIDVIANSAELVVDGEVIGSENIPSTATTTSEIVFEDLNWDLEAGETVEVIVRVDVNELTGGFVAGDTLSASVNPDEDSWDMEDEEGENVGDDDKSGSASSDAHAFYADGIQVTLVSTDEEAFTVDGTNNDYVTLTIKFDVTAFGEDSYIDKTVLTTGVANDGTAILAEESDGTDLAAGSSTVTITSTGDEETHTFLVEEGETETITLAVTVANSTTGQLDATDVRALITGIGFSSTDTATEENTYTSNLTNFKSGYARIAD